METPPPDRTIGSIEPKRVVIDGAGDLILEVGTKPQSRLQVSSKVLSTASRVFRAMFNPSFKEGQALSQTNPAEIPLPEDDPAAMETLLKILHLQNTALPTVNILSADGFRDFAVVCDKYDCNDAVSFVANSWLQEFVSNPGPYNEDSNLVLLGATSFLNNAPGFQDITRNLILNSSNSFLDRDIEDDTYTVPALELYVALEKQREALRRVIHLGLMEPIQPLIDKNNYDKTPINDSRVSAYLRELRRLKLWPLAWPNRSINSVLDDLSHFEEKELGTSLGFRMHGRHPQCSACQYDPRTKLDLLIKKVELEAAGLCLDCLHRGSSPAPGGTECRVKHN
ncbi:hypothetical protein GQ53DRAFT_862305 [Thozetella sp. PMI_491]|nr:hypothetical protein GQ53DRAFT_862305 [Thozetella sp. PMI_491]